MSTLVPVTSTPNHFTPVVSTLPQNQIHSCYDQIIPITSFWHWKLNWPMVKSKLLNNATGILITYCQQLCVPYAVYLSKISHSLPIEPCVVWESPAAYLTKMAFWQYTSRENFTIKYECYFLYKKKEAFWWFVICSYTSFFSLCKFFYLFLYMEMIVRRNFI